MVVATLSVAFNWGGGGGGGLSGIDCGCNITRNMSSASGISKNNGRFKVCVLMMVKPLMQEHVEYSIIIDH